MTVEECDRQSAEISAGLIALLEGKDKKLAIVACLSIASTTAFMIGMPKLELQKMLMRIYDKREKEGLAEVLGEALGR